MVVGGQDILPTTLKEKLLQPHYLTAVFIIIVTIL